MLLSTLLLSAQKRLAAAGIADPAMDTRLLVAHALCCDRLALIIHAERELREEETTAIEALIARREKREPTYRIIGSREFWGLPFGLNEATLEPRPDSETLIEEALRLCKTPPARLLDLGTGTGCLLLSLLHEWPHATGLGLDASPRALEQAQANAQALGLEARAAFRLGDWLSGVTETFDVIVCNPPYIPTRDLPSLQEEVLLHDPAAALDGGADGLAPYRAIIPRLSTALNAGGVALFEIGIGQADAVAALMAAEGLTDIFVKNDLAGIPRCVSCRKG